MQIQFRRLKDHCLLMRQTDWIGQIYKHYVTHNILENQADFSVLGSFYPNIATYDLE